MRRPCSSTKAWQLHGYCQELHIANPHLSHAERMSLRENLPRRNSPFT
jgi:hypothetical protein